MNLSPFKPSYFVPAIRYNFAKEAPRLSVVIKDRDLNMAGYLLERHPADLDNVALGHGMIYAVENAGVDHQDWLRVVRSIRRHPGAAMIDACLIRSALGSTARNMNEGMAQELLSFPQIAALDSHDWDQILFECLPKGDPEKKRIEKRNFEDREGHPGILAMVRAAMAGGVATAARGALQPRP